MLLLHPIPVISYFLENTEWKKDHGSLHYNKSTWFCFLNTRISFSNPQLSFPNTLLRFWISLETSKAWSIICTPRLRVEKSEPRVLGEILGHPATQSRLFPRRFSKILNLSFDQNTRPSIYFKTRSRAFQTLHLSHKRKPKVWHRVCKAQVSVWKARSRVCVITWLMRSQSLRVENANKECNL